MKTLSPFTKQLVPISLLLLFLSACASTQDAPAEGTAPPPAPTDTLQPPTPKATAAPICTSMEMAPTQSGELFWWNDRVFYEIFVRSFYDSNGDGIGDFNGIVEKLDYLNDGDDSTQTDLGISGIWLMPINASPSYHGYDIADYYAVNPEYGTLDEFQNLLDEAHARGIEVIIDLVPNHTSTHHPWFEEAISDPAGKFRDYYIISDSSGGYDSPWGTPVWHSISGGGFYYGIFGPGFADLNYDNPQVVEEMQSVVRYWLEDVGVDGFRLDAIKHIDEDGQIQENTPGTHAYLKGFFEHYMGISSRAFTVGEAITSPQEMAKYTGDEVNIVFEFSIAAGLVESARSGQSPSITKAHELALNTFPLNQFGSFLSNHDQTRIMSVFLNDWGKAKTAAGLLLSGPGVPFIYYGEEVGQKGSKPDENIRSPMQWSSKEFAGFTEGLPWRFPQRGFEEVNVALQDGDPDSLLSHYRRLIHLRNENEALRGGSMLQMPVGNPFVYAFLRYTERQTLLVIINLDDDPVEDYVFCLEDAGLTAGQAVEILQGVEIRPPTLNASGGFDNYRPMEVLEPYTSYIIALE